MGTGRGQQPRSCSSQPAPGRARGGHKDTGFLPALPICVGSSAPQPWQHPGEAGVSRDTHRGSREPCLPRTGLAWSFVFLARAGCEQRPAPAVPAPAEGSGTVPTARGPRPGGTPQARGRAALGVPEMPPALALFESCGGGLPGRRGVMFEVGLTSGVLDGRILWCPHFLGVPALAEGGWGGHQTGGKGVAVLRWGTHKSPLHPTPHPAPSQPYIYW